MTPRLEYHPNWTLNFWKNPDESNRWVYLVHDAPSPIRYSKNWNDLWPTVVQLRTPPGEYSHLFVRGTDRKSDKRRTLNYSAIFHLSNITGTFVPSRLPKSYHEDIPKWLNDLMMEELKGYSFGSQKVIDFWLYHKVN